MNSTDGCTNLTGTLTAVIAAVTLIGTILLSFWKIRAKLVGHTAEDPREVRLSKKWRNRLYKIHANVEALMENAGLEKTSVS
jgi:hypothetical protein